MTVFRNFQALTTVTSAIPTASTGSVTFTVADPSVLPAAPFSAWVYPQTPGDVSGLTRARQSQKIDVTLVSGSSVTATLGADTPGRAISFGDVVNASDWPYPAYISPPNRAYVDGIMYPLTSAGINAAIVFVGTNGGGTVEFRGDAVPCATKIIQPYSNVTLQGVGAGDYYHSQWDAYGTSLVWTGGNLTNGDYFIDFGAAAGASHPVKTGGIKGIHIDGLGSTIAGLRLRSIVGCDIDITARGFNDSYAIRLALQPDVDTAALESSGNQGNKIKAVIYQTFPSGNNGGGVIFDEAGGCSLNELDLRIFHSGRLNGLYWGNADFNFFKRLSIQRQPIACTITHASPAVITQNGHGYVAGQRVCFGTFFADTLPTPLVAQTPYYVLAAGLTANTLHLSLTSGGAAINTTSDGSGTHEIGPVSAMFTGAVTSGNVIMTSTDNGVLLFTGNSGGKNGANRILNPDYADGGPLPIYVDPDSVLVLPPSGDRIIANRTSGSQSIADGGAEVVFPTVVEDVAGQYSSGTGTILPLYNGTYDIEAVVSVTTNTADSGKSYYLQMFKGAIVAAIGNWYTQPDSTARLITLTIRATIDLVTGEGIAVYLMQNTGGARVASDPLGDGGGFHLRATNIRHG